MFVSAHRTEFELNGQPFPANGANCYYASHRSDQMVNAAFRVMTGCGFNILRTWAFLDVPEPRPGAWFQSAPGQFNDGPNGLELLDRTVALAESLDIKLILPLVNHWDDFGGMNQYRTWLGLSRREDFYTDGRARQAYRDWVEHVLLRVNSRTNRQYRDEPAIMAWELANEPRCEIPGGREILLEWSTEMSRFIKSLDGNHLVGLGDEGFFTRARAGRHHPYDGTHGVDCEALMGIPTLDFGVCHLYPNYEPDVTPAEFGARWIREHIQAGNRANKPMLIEEYGTTEPASRDRVFAHWWSVIQEERGAGGLLWMIASTADDGQPYPDYDHYTVYSPAEIPSVAKPAPRVLET
jgi:mannan endo-1,4-beta-mannosidase